ncbi:MAG: ATP-binding cassette domain-containing protein [Planctomycetota bacterium]|nr:ATP-binding cassette domain-containing protein [Planctomycetota bacterium]
MIAVDKLSIVAGGFQLANISFEIPSGAYGVLLGRSGSGKTTLLETLCGLRSPQSGTIRLGDRDATQLKPADRAVGYVPQDGALFSGMIVREQIAFALRVRRISHQQMEHRISELADWLEIEHLMDRTPERLSGGESQRVALGRALAHDPATLLLDEPLSALDDESRDHMYTLLSRITQHKQVSVLHVTHNQQDVERLADFVLRLDAQGMAVSKLTGPSSNRHDTATKKE